MKRQASLTDIQVTYDFICPWCWIGGENLDRALAVTGLSATRRITYVPYQLNPNMPAQGMDRKTYRSGKFGSWARSQAMDAQVTQAGRAVGLVFDYERAEKTPNTLAAHRLIWRQQQIGTDASGLVKAIFKAYFAEGRDIGDVDVLVDIAGENGLDRDLTLSFLKSSEGISEVLALEAAAKARDVHSVPHLRMGSDVISGAQPVDVISQSLLAGERS
ncbi:disulfide bond formation protein DsbA [Pseudomonas frederiksbergensis]|uniref:Disulfide bond formation protein DsbA n=1 Tax=Pseudomonas frederiksbergensis TaxID=104087 RepID=A0A1J0ESN9_9PSED|nr:DsbA family oxidoreductase [Pseudomonas frederiksbergensis]APC18796.1 disulfide bond formation protein DsbA [Pseudomonas frederiksbergensis]